MMPVTRIRRTRPSPVVESPPVRVRRVRSVDPSPPVKKIARRTRPVHEFGSGSDRRPRFEMDWSKSLGYKLQIYMVTSYLYYELCRSVITDHEFDRLCKELAAGWDDFEHQHKHCTDKGSMVAATGYANTYPLMVQNAAHSMLDHFREV